MPAGVQAVDVLRDHRLERAAPLELDERVVRAVGLLAAQRREAVPVEPPERAGSRRKTSMCATSIGSTFAHSPVPGERKSGMPGGHGDPRAGQRDDAAAPSGSAGRAVAGALTRP